MGIVCDIGYCDSSVNPAMGCEGCELWTSKDRTCYAGNLTARYAGKPGWPEQFEKVTLFPGRMETAAGWPDLTGTKRPDKPWLDGLPRIIFIGDMGDVLSRSVSFEYLLSEVIEHVSSLLGRRHVWLLLTKQATRLAEFDRFLEERRIPWPDNLFAGVSVTTESSLKRVGKLIRTRAMVKWVSNEPAREAVDFSRYLRRLDWMVIGGESGADAHPFSLTHLRWGIDNCQEAGVPIFVKQLGSAPLYPGPPMALTLNDHKGADWSEWPERMRVRKMPYALGVGGRKGTVPAPGDPR